MSQIQKNQQPTAQNYYTNGIRKIRDFFIGLFGVIILHGVSYLIAAMGLSISWLNFVAIICGFLTWPILIAAIVFAAKAKRKYIIWGICFAYLIPFIFFAFLFGMCSLGLIK
jgi:hypothetical protein